MNADINDYTVIAEQSHTSLVMKVRELLGQGWQPVGGIAVSPDDGSSKIYYQAMCKHTAPTEANQVPSAFLTNEV